MTFQFALKCDKVKGKNPNIKDAISIIVINEFVPLIVDVAVNHGGLSSGSPVARGNFRPRFVIEDSGELEAAVELQAVATNKARTGEKYTITRYSVQDNEVVKDTEMVFNAHYCLIDTMDSTTSDKQHVFALESAQARSKVDHMSFKAGTGATKLKTDQNVATILMVDQSGQGIIQPA